jgi:hypothetical protein
MNLIDPPSVVSAGIRLGAAKNHASRACFRGARLEGFQNGYQSAVPTAVRVPARVFHSLFTGVHDGRSDEMGFRLSRAVEILRGDDANVIQAPGR